MEYLVSPAPGASWPTTGRRILRTSVAGFAALGCLAAVVALVSGDVRGTGLLQYYQPWQAPATPTVDTQKLVADYASGRMRAEERGVLHALYRSANGGDSASPLVSSSAWEPALAGAPSYASELNLLEQDMPSRRDADAEEQAAPPVPRRVEALRMEAAARLRQKQAAIQATGADVLQDPKAVKDAEQLQAVAPPGYHLAFVPDAKRSRRRREQQQQQQQLGYLTGGANENGGRDELPYFPMPPVDEDMRPGQHVEWVAPGPCMLRDGTDMGYADAECQHHEVVDDQYPERPLLTTTFPNDVYKPDTKYPYIKGPFYHHLVNGLDHQYEGFQRGHWVWKDLGRFKRPQPPRRGSYAEWFADFRNPNNDGRYGQGYGQDGRR